MIETIVLNYLKTNKGLTVYMEQPKTKPSAFYLLEKTAGGQADKINTSTFVVQSYATTLYDAALMNETVKGAMADLINLDAVSRVELNSDYNYTDPTTKQYRYQAVFVLTHY